jgi:hypothetical protein
MMKRLLVSFLVFCAISASSSPSRADECVTEVKASPASECVVMKRGDLRGAWMTLDKWDAARAVAIDLSNLKIDLSNYQELVTLQSNQVALQEEALRERKAAAEKNAQAFDAQKAQTQTIAGERDKALASNATTRIVWTVVGVALGGAATVGGYFAFKEVGVIK